MGLVVADCDETARWMYAQLERTTPKAHFKTQVASVPWSGFFERDGLLYNMGHLQIALF
jgi:hypothetical protein